MDDHKSALVDSLTRLNAGGLLSSIVARMEATLGVVNVDLRNAVVAEIPAFSDSRNPRLLPDLISHGSEQVKEIIRLLDSGPVEDFAFVREYAERRASQRFPLEAMLHAYRCGHKIFARWLRQAVLDTVSSSVDDRQLITSAADFAMEFTNAISTISTSAYVSQIR